MNKWRVVVLSFCIMFCLSACASTHFDQPIGAFQKSVDESVGVISTYYNNLNTFERTLYLENAFYNPGQKIEATDKTGKPTPLISGTFSAEGIKARIDSLSLISIYAKRLAALSATDAPTQFAANTKVLGNNLVSLGNTFSSLAGSGSDSTASAYIGPISSLVGLVGQIYIEQQRDTALTKAITNGDPVVRKILALLESDMVNVVGPLTETGDKLLLSQLVNYYNNNVMTMSQAERRQVIDNINVAAQNYSMAVLFNPSNLVSGIADANQALVKYATSSKQPKDFAELVSDLELFANRVDTVAGAIQKLK